MNPRTYRVTHRTRYRYGATMTDGYSVACLVPRPTADQVVHEAEVRLLPSASEWDSYLDVFGNLVNQFGLHEPHTDMLVEAVSVVEVSRRAEPIDATPWEQVADLVADARGDLALEVGFFRSSSAFVDIDRLRPALAPMVAHAFPPGRPIVEAVRALCLQIFDEFEFDPHFSNVATPLEAVLSARRGVCQDFAHLAIACLRALGLAARYVSGYIESAPPPGEERLVGADASHAWCSVWTPEAGWIDFDPTNGHIPADQHVTVAWGRDYDDVIPVRGVMIGPATSQELDVSVDIVRV